MGSLVNSEKINLIEPEEVDSCEGFKTIKASSERQQCFVEFDVSRIEKLTIHREDLINILNWLNDINDADWD